MLSLALLFVGFSVLGAVLLTLTHFRESHYAGEQGVRLLGMALVAALAGLQLAHWGWLYLDRPWVDTLAYRLLLFSVAPAFWGFSRPLLRTDRPPGLRPAGFAHALPIALAPWLPLEVALPLAFVIGAGYLLALAHDLLGLRAQREQFAREIVILGSIFAIALGVAGLGIFQARLPDKLFFVLYSIAIGMAFLLVQIALGLRPHLSEEVAETTKASYANSTLTRVDPAAMLERLDAAMAVERRYEDPELNLASLAKHLGLSGHQLSELINSQLGKGFSRYLRERRIAAAKAMLLAEPSASVLSIGMCVGFSAQSNFYDAFREIEGMTPGQFRKLHGEARPGISGA